jgi:hypothetical protein
MTRSIKLIKSIANNLKKQIEEEYTDEKKSWAAANFLIACTFFVLLVFGSYIGYWGLIDNKAADLKLFPQAFFAYGFAKLLPLPWCFIAWLLFILLQIYTNSVDQMQLTFGYFIGIALAIWLINKTSWQFWILAPIVVHLTGLLFLASFQAFHGANLIEYLGIAQALSQDSILIELITIYPIILIFKQINKLLDWCRYLE